MYYIGKKQPKKPEQFMLTDGMADSTQLHRLKMRMLYPHEAKIGLAMVKIREWQAHCHGKTFVSVSGGKDSLVLLHLVRTEFPKTPAVFVDTGLEYPSVREAALNTENVTVIRPKMSFKKVIERYGYPAISRRQAQYLYEISTCKNEDSATFKLRTTGITSSGKFSQMSKISDKYLHLVPLIRSGEILIGDKCCDVMKKRPLIAAGKSMGGALPFIGTMASDSRNRFQSWRKHGCNITRGTHRQSRPLMAWTEQDILRYIVGNGLEIPHVYGDIANKDGEYSTTGVDRTGCMFCAFGAHLEKQPGRFVRMLFSHPKQYIYVTEKLGASKIFDLLGIAY